MTTEQQELVVNNLKLVDGMLHDLYPHRWGELPYEDYQSIGRVALCEAAIAYDATKGVFSSFACRLIRWKILRYESKRRTQVPSVASIQSEIHQNGLGLDYNNAEHLTATVEEGYDEVEIWTSFAKMVDKKTYEMLRLCASGKPLMEVAKTLNITRQALYGRLQRLRRKLFV